MTSAEEGALPGSTKTGDCSEPCGGVGGGGWDPLLCCKTSQDPWSPTGTEQKAAQESFFQTCSTCSLDSQGASFGFTLRHPDALFNSNHRAQTSRLQFEFGKQRKLQQREQIRCPSTATAWLRLAKLTRIRHRAAQFRARWRSETQEISGGCNFVEELAQWLRNHCFLMLTFETAEVCLHHRIKREPSRDQHIRLSHPNFAFVLLRTPNEWENQGIPP